jgi:hypothetical protein
MDVLTTKIRRELEDLSMAADAFALVADISKSQLSRAFRGLCDFDGPTAYRLLQIIGDLRQIQKDCTPFPISFATKDALVIRGLLNTKRVGLHWYFLRFRLDPEVTEPETEFQTEQ